MKVSFLISILSKMNQDADAYTVAPSVKDYVAENPLSNRVTIALKKPLYMNKEQENFLVSLGSACIVLGTRLFRVINSEGGLEGKTSDVYKLPEILDGIDDDLYLECYGLDNEFLGWFRILIESDSEPEEMVVDTCGKEFCEKVLKSVNR